MQANSVFIGAAAGSTLMFLLDPVAGRRRRALMRDQITRATRRGRDGLVLATEEHSLLWRWSPSTCAMLGAGLLASGVWVARAATRQKGGTEYTYGEP